MAAAGEPGRSNAKGARRFTKAQEAVSEIEAVLCNLQDERRGQFSRIEGLTGLITEQKAIVTGLITEQKAIVVRDRHFEEQPLAQLARSYQRDPWWPELQSLRRISMLHYETLYLLRSLAARTKDAIVEVGPYIGGSTIATWPRHPDRRRRALDLGRDGRLIPRCTVPTDNIITDLKSNVEAYGLAESVHILEGFTTAEAAMEAR